MLNVRRLYVLTAAFIGLLLFLQGGSDLLRLVFLLAPGESDSGIDSAWWREQLSIGIALVAVGTPLWLGHWIWAQRLARDRAEAASALRSLYFLGVLTVTVFIAGGAAGTLLFDPLSRLAGGVTSTSQSLESLARLIIYGLFWVYHLRHRPAPALQMGWAATISRWYWYVLSFVSVGVAATSVIFVIATLLQRAVGVEAASTGHWEVPLANSIAWTIVGSIGWAIHWVVIQRRAGEADSPELRSVLRKVYLYLMVGSGAAGALVAIGRVLYWILLSVTGAVEDRMEITDDLTRLAPIALVAVIGWFYHRNQLRRDAALVAELPRQATIRRIYTYILSGIGVALLAVGAFGILRLVIGILTGQAEALDLPQNFLQRQLSLYVTLLLVGLLAWVWYWGQAQRHAAADDSGEERQSLVRRIYLALASSAGVIALAVAVGVLLYQGLRSILGISSGNDLIDALNIYLSAGLIALTGLVYHARFLWLERRGARKEAGPTDAEPPAAESAAPAQEQAGLVAMITGGDVQHARRMLQDLALPEGAEMALMESELSPQEIQRRLAASAADED